MHVVHRDAGHAAVRELRGARLTRIIGTSIWRLAVSNRIPRTFAFALPFALSIVLAAGCGRSPGPAQSTADSTPANVEQPAATGDTAPESASADAEADRAAELDAREKSLADREAELKQKELEAELARRDAENAAAAAASAKAAASRPAPAAKAPPPKAPAVAAKTPSQPPPPIQVPAGTGIAIALASDLTTKTAQVGDPVQGRLGADLMVDGRRAAAAGAPVSGTVTKVVSGSAKVGGTPTLVVKFDSLVAADGSNVSIDAPYKQQGTSETAKDTAKIVGGAAAGAIIGHQVSKKSGSVVGGVLGGAAGTAIAHGTGNEVTIPAGTVVNVTVRNAFQVSGG